MIYLFIAPLMAAFTLFAFILFFLSFRFSTPRVYYNDYGGLLYLSALNHLFVGAYVQQITLIGLYLSVRDTKHQYACIGQTVITVISLGLTFSFQLHLRDRAKNMASHMPVVEKRDRIHQSECSFLYRWFSLDCTPFTRAASLPPPSFNANALNIQPPIIWIPRDRLGLSHAKVAQALTNHYQPRFSDANACVDTSGHLHIGGPSPEQMLASSDDPEATTPSLHMSIATKSG